MAKNKTNKSTAIGKTNGARSKELLRKIASASAVTLAIIALGLSYIALFERPANNLASITRQAEALAAGQAAAIDQSLSQFQLRLSTIAQSEPLLQALEQQDNAQITRFQNELRRAFPEAVSIKLIALGPLGIASLNQKQHQLRNNIELDILRAASSGSDVNPEAYKVDKQWYFSLAQSIKSADTNHANGALLLTLDGNYLQHLMGQLDSTLGTTTVAQYFKSKRHLVSSSGQQQPSELSVSVDSTASQWKIGFTPSNQLIEQSSSNSISLWLLLALAVVALVATTLYINNAVEKLVQNNIAQLFKARNNSTSFSLPGFAGASSKLTALLDKALESSTQTPAATPHKPVDSVTDTPAVAPTPEPPIATDIADVIFRAYDIRGRANEQLTDQAVYHIALAIGSEALDQGQQRVVVAADGRHSSPRILEAMNKGLLASGRDVIDIGMQPTPLMYFATHELGTQTGVMITGSHNPAEDNGIKIVIGGRALAGDAIKNLQRRIVDGNLHSGQGEYQSCDIEQAYVDYIINDVAIAQPLKIVIDAGNGVTGMIAPHLFRELGCEVVELFCDIDGDFPNHHPDPTVEANLEDLKRSVVEEGADIGIAFDGDGDRLGVVTASGKSVAADRLLMLFAQDVVSRNPGADVIFDVKCTRSLNSLVSNYGGRPIMWKSGHSFMKEKMQETGALLGGEFSGHIFFKERWFGFDDGMYAAARLIEILSTTDPDLDVQLEAFPEYISSPELKIVTGEQQKFSIIEKLQSDGQFGDGKLSTLDGLRVDFADGWGLARASNTTPMLTLRFEADNEAAMQRIQQQFKQQLTAIDGELEFTF